MVASHTEARALHDLLEAVKGTGVTINTAWESVLGAKWDSVEFARRHGEVVALLATTVDQIQQLNARQQGRFSTYIPMWWHGVMAPLTQWQAHEAGSIITQDHLNFLDAAADIISASVDPEPNVSEKLEALRSDCEGWVDFLVQVPDVPQSLRIDLLLNLKHVIWLIENVDLFGAARVVDGGHRVLGSVFTAAPVVAAPKQSAWLDRARRLGKAVYDVMKVIGVMHGTFDAGEAVFGSLQGGPGEDEPRQLPQGRSDEN